MTYAVIDIGCIECGESSGLVGTYTDLAEAQSALERAEGLHQKYWRGQHYFFLVDMSTSTELTEGRMFRSPYHAGVTEEEMTDAYFAYGEWVKLDV